MKNLNIEKIKEISKIKKEPSWMTDFRINAFNAFENLSNPKFGPELKIDFDIINYYKKMDDKIHNKRNGIRNRHLCT